MGLEREGRWRFGVRNPEATKDEELHPKRRQKREREGQKGPALRGEAYVRKGGGRLRAPVFWLMRLGVPAKARSVRVLAERKCVSRERENLLALGNV